MGVDVPTEEDADPERGEGATIHAETIPNITSSSVPFATPSPAIAPTAVIEVEAVTPKRFEMSREPPVEKEHDDARRERELLGHDPAPRRGDDVPADRSAT